MQKYKVFSAIDLSSTSSIDTIWRGGIEMNIAFEVESTIAAKDTDHHDAMEELRAEHARRLAAKDAEIKGLQQRLALIAWWCGANDAKV